MKQLFDLLEVCLNLFDGDGGASGAAPAAQGDNAGEAADTAGQAGQTGEKVDAAARREAYFAAINGEYKDIYEQEFQKSLDKRMRAKARETERLQAQIKASQPVIDLLFARYGITDGSMEKLNQALDQDNAYWEGAAEQSGMSVEQYKRVQQMQLENARLRQEQDFSARKLAVDRQLAKWDEEADALREEYPEFDFSAEVQSDVFLSLLKNGFSVKNAYESVHVGELLEQKARQAAAAAEKKVTDNIRAKGGRPAENGSQQGAGFVTKIDVSQTTKKDREELARRAARGEKIIL